VRSALLSVKGVTRVQVRLEEHEAIVTYDPSQATVEQMIKAVAEAEGPPGPRPYTATVKKEPPAAS
jgi:copper chaperone CopZ